MEAVVMLRENEDLDKWFSDNQKELIHFFGGFYKAEKTDFDLITSYYISFKSLNTSYPVTGTAILKIVLLQSSIMNTLCIMSCYVKKLRRS